MTTCPACKDARAYVGFSTVECVNLGCEHYSETWSRENRVPPAAGAITWWRSQNGYVIERLGRALLFLQETGVVRPLSGWETEVSEGCGVNSNVLGFTITFPGDKKLMRSVVLGEWSSSRGGILEHCKSLDSALYGLFGPPSAHA